MSSESFRRLADIWKEVESTLECPSCQTLYQEPRVAPCGHVFCTRCLYSQYSDSTSPFSCSLCGGQHHDAVFMPVGCLARVVTLIDGTPGLRHAVQTLLARADESERVQRSESSPPGQTQTQGAIPVPVSSSPPPVGPNPVGTAVPPLHEEAPPPYAPDHGHAVATGMPGGGRIPQGSGQVPYVGGGARGVNLPPQPHPPGFPLEEGTPDNPPLGVPHQHQPAGGKFGGNDGTELGSKSRLIVPSSQHMTGPSRPSGSTSVSERGPLGSNLFICRLPEWANEADILRVARPLGVVVGCKVMRHENGVSKNIAHLSFESPRQAFQAMKALNGAMIEMDPSDPRRNSTRLPRCRAIKVEIRKSEISGLLGALKKEEAADFLAKESNPAVAAFSFSANTMPGASAHGRMGAYPGPQPAAVTSTPMMPSSAQPIHQQPQQTPAPQQHQCLSTPLQPYVHPQP
uniref:RING-type domain-containing protein n=1 Tax=Chromera velia CCMP2878 TaxID=1169474 RepID=A0A0G4HQ55_9ALVE|eukprot:Cvel_7874.t1-p1 / transcript=Cvel_7874.t1 / gene=Cvel_7874 / organism=Chromera_velia_CCMP2878 / gene_product=CUGBP Elav-like family member 6, putative / transcript_product=CUGBP Elav-like family member 6, putative / location=Cvel_scaffold422:30655-33019(-) / protein_length=457 / sequence_SO=supercontig / SO=protein_coding / is_pseudo=false